MGTIADKLALLGRTKADIKAALTEKGAAPSEVFSTYGDEIRGLPTGGGISDPADPVEVYRATRPTDWLPMPAEADVLDNEIYLLFHIPDGVSSLLAFTVTCTGDYTVALGTMANGAFVEQSAVAVASGAKYEAELMAADFGDLTSTGRKQVMIKVSGRELLTWTLSTHSKKTEPTDFTGWNIVELVCRMSKGTTVQCGGTGSASLAAVKYFSWYGTNAATDMSYMFYGCCSLTAVPRLDTSLVTDMNNMFYACCSLTAMPRLDTSLVADMNNMFAYCCSLTAVPQLDTSLVTNMKYMFSGCSSLATVPQLDMSLVTYTTCMFAGCYSLMAVPQLDISLADGMSDMFDYCCSLNSILLTPTAAGWSGCDITLENCMLGHTALVAFFHSLPAITEAKVITIAGNPGVAELTDAEKAIATQKGWTLWL